MDQVMDYFITVKLGNKEHLTLRNNFTVTKKCGNQEIMAYFLQSIISLVPKSFHIMRGSGILWVLFNVKFQN